MGTLGAGHLPPPPMVGPPLAGLASLGLGHTQKEWDQLSMYSQRTDRSAPRGRLYQMDRGGKWEITSNSKMLSRDNHLKLTHCTFPMVT